MSAITAGAVAVGGSATYIITRDSDILDDHFSGTEKTLAARFGSGQAAGLMKDIHQEYEALVPGMPDIGGKDNIFTEWLIFGVYYLAVYQVLKAKGETVEEAGRIIYDTFKAMADYPKWLLRLVGNIKYNEKYLTKLEEAVTKTQERRYPGDWVAAFIQGDGESFDYGLDITECGICKFYHAQGADELAPYLCLSDYVVSEAFERGLVRYKTLAEGGEVCDFRFMKGRQTFVNPLRDGWPPRFLSQKA
ncbi:MAG: L-2-amino-thiazoline-4-carboxylic acid hydrolase [Deltaproteobacteria bacterium]|nr:L-2-amino-thiazoline-4-carboxylic acid hydrolase [Deltaproteobacteria bacterium]